MQFLNLTCAGLIFFVPRRVPTGYYPTSLIQTQLWRSLIMSFSEPHFSAKLAVDEYKISKSKNGG
jgi:hypothetical protein